MSSTLPLGLPQLMKAFNTPEEVTADTIRDHERRTGTNVQSKAEFRASYVDKSYQPLSGADEKGPHLELTLKGCGV